MSKKKQQVSRLKDEKVSLTPFSVQRFDDHRPARLLEFGEETAKEINVPSQLKHLDMLVTQPALQKMFGDFAERYGPSLQ